MTAALKRKEEYINIITDPSAEGNIPYVYIDSTCNMTVGIGINIAGKTFKDFRLKLFSDGNNFNINSRNTNLSDSEKSKLSQNLETVFNSIITKIKDDSNKSAPCNYLSTAYSPSRINVVFEDKVEEELYNFSLSEKGKQLVKQEFTNRLNSAIDSAANIYDNFPGNVSQAKFPKWNDLPYHIQWYLVDRVYNFGAGRFNKLATNLIPALKQGDWDILQTKFPKTQNITRERNLSIWLAQAKIEESKTPKQMIPEQVAPLHPRIMQLPGFLQKHLLFALPQLFIP